MNTSLETICVRITTRCNLICKHCWAPRKREAIDINPYELLEYLISLKKLGLQFINISGGEPTLYPHIGLLIELLQKQEFIISITTNGASDHSLCDIVPILSLPHDYKIKIRISLDGYKTLHDSLRGEGVYNRAITEAIRITKTFGMVNINTVVMTPPNQLETVIEDLRSTKINEWALMTPVARGQYECQQYNINNIFRNLELWREALNDLQPSAKVLVWDYLSHPNGGLVIDTDGLLSSPGLSENTDIIIGYMKEVKIDLIEKYINQRLEKDPIAFFCHEYDQ